MHALRFHEFEIEDGVVKISLSEKVQKPRLLKNAVADILEHLKHVEKLFFGLQERQTLFHGIFDLKQSYDLAHTKVAYKCDAPTEQIEASFFCPNPKKQPAIQNLLARKDKSSGSGIGDAKIAAATKPK